MRYNIRKIVPAITLGAFLSVAFIPVPAALGQSGAAGEATRAQAERLGRLFQLDKLLGSANGPLRRNLVEALANEAPKASDADLAAAGEAIETALNEGSRNLENSVLELYRSRLTRAEMASLIDFYALPTGAPVMTKIGLIMII